MPCPYFNNRQRNLLMMSRRETPPLVLEVITASCISLENPKFSLDVRRVRSHLKQAEAGIPTISRAKPPLQQLSFTITFLSFSIQPPYMKITTGTTALVFITVVHAATFTVRRLI